MNLQHENIFITNIDYDTTLKKCVLEYFPWPHSCKNWKAGFSRSSSAGLTSEKSFTWIELERSSTENGMLHSNMRGSLEHASLKLETKILEYHLFSIM